MRYSITLLAVIAALAAWYYPSLPATLATHFNGAGAADGWMEKGSFYVLFGFLVVFLTGTFLGTAAAMRMLPDSMINLPNKQYWLAPERREASIATMRDAMMRMGEATLLLMGVLMVMTFEANLRPEPRLGAESWIVLVLYLAVIGVLVSRLILSFRHVPGGADTGRGV